MNIINLGRLLDRPIDPPEGTMGSVGYEIGRLFQLDDKHCHEGQCTFSSVNGRSLAHECGKRDKTLSDLTFSPDVIAGDERRACLNAENGKPLNIIPAKSAQKLKVFGLAGPLAAKKHEFRAIAIGVNQ